jgi:hypothetical protein|tara:strand:+ start:1551 stop:1664 length:114 start_codon:yes stop_codon:yes gene_type:complete
LIYLAVYGKLFEEKLAIEKGEEKTFTIRGLLQKRLVS